jgi:F-type H+-transporting ATPase subunit gamma
MSRRRELERRRRTAEEVREILDAMKSLAYMETRKLARFLDAQRQVVRHVERNAADLLAYYPDCLPSPEAGPRGYLLVGSERGFCGDFNGALLRRLEGLSGEAPDPDPRIIAVGHKLCVRLEGDPRIAALLDGATVVEEVESVLATVVEALTESGLGIHSLSALYQDPDRREVVVAPLVPSFEESRGAEPRYSHPPLLNLAPERLVAELADQHLFAGLHEILFVSLMAESQERVAHLTGALDHLDQTLEALARQGQALRQEEIVEEIEVILLSAEELGRLGVA